MARTLVGTSPWPVMNTMGSARPAARSEACRSRPLRPDRRTSRTRHAGRSGESSWLAILVQTRTPRHGTKVLCCGGSAHQPRALQAIVGENPHAIRRRGRDGDLEVDAAPAPQLARKHADPLLDHLAARVEGFDEHANVDEIVGRGVPDVA